MHEVADFAKLYLIVIYMHGIYTGKREVFEGFMNNRLNKQNESLHE